MTFFEATADDKLGTTAWRTSSVLPSPRWPSLCAAARGESKVGVFDADRCGNGGLGSDEQCDDGNLVANDGCSGGCRLELCGPTPLTGCKLASTHHAAVKLRDKTPNDRADQLSWSWHGQATAVGEFGDPMSNANHLLCVYDTSFLPQPRATFAAPAGGLCPKGPCWRSKSGGYFYKDALLTPDGLADAWLREGLQDDRPRIKIREKRQHLFAQVSLPPLLPLATPVTVQLTNTETGAC